MTESIRAPEVRCERCACSFAPGTKVCIHCGAKLATGRGLGRIRGPGEPPAEETPEPRQVVAQAAVAILSVGLMVMMALLRACGDS